MGIIIFVFVGVMCLYLGTKAYYDENQTKVFTKYPPRVSDVKAYNHMCGRLVIGFGVVVDATYFLASVIGGWVSTVMLFVIALEAFILVKLYRRGEKKLMQK